MKKTLSVLAVVGVVSMLCAQSASAFTWSDLNPFNWGRCNRCEKKIEQCPCPTGYAAPCDPCEKKTPCTQCGRNYNKSVPCEPCDRLQQQMAK